MRKATQLRQALAGDGPLQLIGAHDGLGAKLAEEAGFDGVWASGLEISASAGVPDANILTMTEFLHAAVEMNQATRLPVICDCDTGFGNSNNVIHLVRQYEAAGLAAVAIEDKLFPKVNSFVAGRQDLAPISEFVGKIMAAKHAQESEDFVVIARIEALIAGWGEAEALRRAEAYVNAGADAILIHSKAPTPDEVLSFLRRWDRRSPVVIVPTTYPSLTAAEWYDAGVNAIIYANQGLRAAIRAMTETYAAILREGRTTAVEPALASLRRVFELQGMPAMKEQEKRFLRRGDRQYRVVIPAGGDIALPDDLRAIVGRDLPRALLDIYGKPLVQRQVETFARAGIQDVTFVANVEPGQVDLDGVRLVRYRGAGPLDTVRRGLAEAPDDATTTIVCYSDILFGSAVLDTLLGCDAPICVLVDRSYKTDSRYARKRLDYVVADPAPATAARRLDPNQRYAVRRIGKGIDRGDSHFEFIGLLTLSAEGLRTVRDACARYAEEYAGRPFGQAACFAEASLTDLLQQLVDDGHAVTAVEQDKGWLEVHDFEDYRLAIEQASKALT